MPCKFTSSTKLIKTKRPTLQSSKKQNMFMSYSRKLIIKGVKFHIQKFCGLARTLLKMCYRTTNIWYAKLAPTRRKCFIGCEFVNSHPTNHQLTYQSSCKYINPTRRWFLRSLLRCFTLKEKNYASFSLLASLFFTILISLWPINRKVN